MKYSKQEKKWIKEHTPEKEMEAVREYLGKKKKINKKPKKNPKPNKIITTTENIKLKMNSRNTPVLWSQRTADKFVKKINSPISYMNLCKLAHVPEHKRFNIMFKENKYFNLMWYVISKYDLIEKTDYLFVVYKEKTQQGSFDMLVTKNVANIFLDEIDSIYDVRNLYFEWNKLSLIKKSIVTGASVKLSVERLVSKFMYLGQNILIPELIECDREEYHERVDSIWSQQKRESVEKKEVEKEISHKKMFKSQEKIVASNRDEWIKKVREQLLEKQTKAESMLYEYLDTLGIKYTPQKHLLCNGKNYFADAFIPSVYGIIEMDGEYHKTPEQKIKDKERDYNIKSYGIKVCHCDNEEAYDITNFIDKINRELGMGIDAYLYVE